MERTIYLCDGVVALGEYVPELDDRAFYEAWQDEAVVRGYNYRKQGSFEAFRQAPVRSRFLAAILREEDGQVLGELFLSPEDSLPDQAIIIHAPYRGRGYGTRAFRLGVRYAFEMLGLEELYAGCYPHNEASRSMLAACGFQRHPEGDVQEKGIYTGEDIVQQDYVLYKYSDEPKS